MSSDNNVIIGGFAGVLAFGLLIGFMITHSGAKSTGVPANGVSNVAMIDGTQIVTVHAKGGYEPASSALKAGVPTILRFQTNGTFDCSSSVIIPSMHISRNLPANGTTDIPLGILQAGVLHGTCGMGMYRFDLNVSS